MTGLRAIHSPEHVLVELRPAGLGRRFGAFAIDSGILMGVLGAISQLGSFLPRAAASAAVATGSFVALWGYHVLFEVLWNGQTPGKRALRLRVVDGRGLPVGVAQSLVRNVVRLLDLMPAGGIGMLSALSNEDRQRLGDKAADTLVVDERQPVAPILSALDARAFNTLATPRLQRLVQHRVGLEERELIYALCLRGPALSAEARYELFEAVGGHYREALGIEDASLSGEAIVRGVAALCAGRVGERAST